MISSEDDTEPPQAALVRVCRQAWRDALSVYYANTPIWRWLKSGALVMLGLFTWAGGNLLLSYQTGWTWLSYLIAYGFALVFWGPFTHFVIVPLAIRLRRTAEHPVARTVANQASKLNLSVFFAIVVVLGALPFGPMMLDFQGAVGGDGSPDVSASLECDVGDEEVYCQLSETDGVDHVVVTSGDRQLEVVEAEPFEFTLATDDLEDVVGQKQFTVELRDEEGQPLQRFVRTVPG